MIILRNEQLKVFQRYALNQYENKLVEHIKNFVPKSYKIIGEVAIRKIITTGMEQAGKYGFTYKGPIRYYLDLMFLFGSYFDTDPQYAWFQKILSNSEITDQMKKVDLLYENTIEYINDVIGPDCTFEKEALKKSLQINLNDLPSNHDNYLNSVFQYLEHLYPRKFEYIGESALKPLIASGNRYANIYGINNLRGISLLISYMFAFGHRCFDDIQYPWIYSTLHDRNKIDQGNLIRKLHSKIINYFKHIVDDNK